MNHFAFARTRKFLVAWALLLVAMVCTNAVAEPPDAAEVSEPVTRQFTFTWPYQEGSDLAPRGGTSRGSPVKLAEDPSPRWQSLREPGISDFERDRRAILAMAGEFRASFDFIETIGFVAPYEVKRPYRSWGTEKVYVLANDAEFISLQHVIVMFFAGEDGEIAGPHVVKHWRQDWSYQDRNLHRYQGKQIWQHVRLPRSAVSQGWTQTVYQVDDSPRYEAFGRWQHTDNASSWTSDETWRPLPRREFSVRDDYHVLIGTNRHTITPTGWVHEEDNLKVVLAEPGELTGRSAVLAREAGFNRYERLLDFDFSAGDRYVSVTEPFWADVRAKWAAIYADRGRFEIARAVEKQPMFMPLFAFADELSEENPYQSRVGQALINKVFSDYVEALP